MSARLQASIIVPTHGRRELLERTLASLARQEAPPRFEVLVIDDGADPGLTDHVTALALALDVHVIHHAENRGRSAARNSGLARAGGEVLVFLDGDMEVDPGFVAAHVEAHAAPDRVVLGNIRTAPEIPRDAFVEYIDSRGVHKVGPEADIPCRYFMTGNSSVGRELISRAGGFDEEFDEYGGEDTEMGYRLAANGGVFRFAEGALSWHLDLNSVPRMAERLRRYGETMLPILVTKVPEARTELRLDLVEPIDFGSDSAGTVAKKLAVRVLGHRSFWGPASRVAALLPGSVPAAPLFDVIRAAAYLDGYRAALGRRSGDAG